MTKRLNLAKLPNLVGPEAAMIAASSAACGAVALSAAHTMRGVLESITRDFDEQFPEGLQALEGHNVALAVLLVECDTRLA